MEHSLDTQIAVNRDTVAEVHDGEAIIVNMSTFDYVELDRVGTAMWHALLEGGTLNAAVDILLARFETDRATLETDITVFVDQLTAVGLVDAAPAPERNDAAPPAPTTAVDLYLELLIRMVGGFTIRDEANNGRGIFPYHVGNRVQGRDMPGEALSMIGLIRLNNVRALAERALIDGVAGDFVETGVWRGGTTILMRGILAAHQVTDRKVWVVDSFEGLPAPDVEQFPLDAMWPAQQGYLKVTLDEVRANFDSLQLLDDQVVFLKGWFSETLPTAPIEQIALLRLDGDLYESTMDTLNNLYAKVSPGGYVIIDDYNLESCRVAVDEFRETHGITSPLQVIDWAGVWWQVPNV